MFVAIICPWYTFSYNNNNTTSLHIKIKNGNERKYEVYDEMGENHGDGDGDGVLRNHISLCCIVWT